MVFGLSGSDDMAADDAVSRAPLAPLADYRQLFELGPAGTGIACLPAGKRHRMLVVDDSYVVRCFMRRTFEMVGTFSICEVVSASSSSM